LPVSRSAHAVDYLEHPRAARRRRNALKDQSKNFLLVDKIAHAFKHVKTDGHSSLNQSQVIVRPPAYWGQAVWGLSRWDDPTGGVTLSDDVEIDLLDVAKKAVALLREISQTT